MSNSYSHALMNHKGISLAIYQLSKVISPVLFAAYVPPTLFPQIPNILPVAIFILFHLLPCHKHIAHLSGQYPTYIHHAGQGSHVSKTPSLQNTTCSRNSIHFS